MPPNAGSVSAASTSSSSVSAVPPQPEQASCYPMPGRPAQPGCPEAASNPEEEEVEAGGEIDDGAEPEDEDESPPAAEPHPYAQMGDAEFLRKLKRSPSEFGPMSIGFPGQGRLFNGVQMAQGPAYQVVDPSHAWGTQETVDYLSKVITRVNTLHPGSPRLVIGHISSKLGGPLAPHKSHQAGRDVDVGYYHTSELRWFARARADNLDRARTWTLVKGLLKATRIDLILIDRSLQKLLREHAVGSGEDEAWVREVFEGAPGKRAMILHARGHADHIHVRFFNPIAQETGRRAGPTLLAMGLLRKPTKAPPTATITMTVHRVQRGETLAMIARKYNVTVQQIRAANGMLTNRIRPRQELKIPRLTTTEPSAPPGRHRPGHRADSARTRA
jgi:murein endopeptidase